ALLSLIFAYLFMLYSVLMYSFSFFFFFFFFFYLYGHHRDLHSFPTRRSSDLSEVAKNKLIGYPGLAVGGVGVIILLLFLFMGARSEEHTSELQSLAYLVCRLLLEKKKNTTI